MLRTPYRQLRLEASRLEGQRLRLRASCFITATTPLSSAAAAAARGAAAGGAYLPNEANAVPRAAAVASSHHFHRAVLAIGQLSLSSSSYSSSPFSSASLAAHAFSTESSQVHERAFFSSSQPAASVTEAESSIGEGHQDNSTRAAWSNNIPPSRGGQRSVLSQVTKDEHQSQQQQTHDETGRHQQQVSMSGSRHHPRQYQQNQQHQQYQSRANNRSAQKIPQTQIPHETQIPRISDHFFESEAADRVSSNTGNAGNQRRNAGQPSQSDRARDRDRERERSPNRKSASNISNASKDASNISRSGSSEISPNTANNTTSAVNTAAASTNTNISVNTNTITDAAVSHVDTAHSASSATTAVARVDRALFSEIAASLQQQEKWRLLSILLAEGRGKDVTPEFTLYAVVESAASAGRVRHIADHIVKGHLTGLPLDSTVHWAFENAFYNPDSVWEILQAFPEIEASFWHACCSSEPSSASSNDHASLLLYHLAANEHIAVAIDYCTSLVSYLSSYGSHGSDSSTAPSQQQQSNQQTSTLQQNNQETSTLQQIDYISPVTKYLSSAVIALTRSHRFKEAIGVMRYVVQNNYHLRTSDPEYGKSQLKMLSRSDKQQQQDEPQQQGRHPSSLSNVMHRWATHTKNIESAEWEPIFRDFGNKRMNYHWYQMMINFSFRHQSNKSVAVVQSLVKEGFPLDIGILGLLVEAAIANRNVSQLRSLDMLGPEIDSFIVRHRNQPAFVHTSLWQLANSMCDGLCMAMQDDLAAQFIIHFQTLLTNANITETSTAIRTDANVGRGVVQMIHELNSYFMSLMQTQPQPQPQPNSYSTENVARTASQHPQQAQQTRPSQSQFSSTSSPALPVSTGFASVSARPTHLDPPVSSYSPSSSLSLLSSDASFAPLPPSSHPASLPSAPNSGRFSSDVGPNRMRAKQHSVAPLSPSSYPAQPTPMGYRSMPFSTSVTAHDVGDPAELPSSFSGPAATDAVNIKPLSTVIAHDADGLASLASHGSSPAAAVATAVASSEFPISSRPLQTMSSSSLSPSAASASSIPSTPEPFPEVELQPQAIPLFPPLQGPAGYTVSAPMDHATPSSPLSSGPVMTLEQPISLSRYPAASTLPSPLSASLLSQPSSLTVTPLPLSVSSPGPTASDPSSAAVISSPPSLSSLSTSVSPSLSDLAVTSAEPAYFPPSPSPSSSSSSSSSSLAAPHSSALSSSTSASLSTGSSSPATPINATNATSAKILPRKVEVGSPPFLSSFWLDSSVRRIVNSHLVKSEHAVKRARAAAEPPHSERARLVPFAEIKAFLDGLIQGTRLTHFAEIYRWLLCVHLSRSLEAENLSEAEKTLRVLASTGSYLPDNSMFQRFVTLSVHQNRMDLVPGLLQCIDILGIKLNEEALVALSFYYAKQGDLAGYRNTLNQLDAFYSTRSKSRRILSMLPKVPHLSNHLLHAAVLVSRQTGDVAALREISEHMMRQSAIRQEHNAPFVALLQSWIALNHHDAALSVLMRLRGFGNRVDKKSEAALAHHFASRLQFAVLGRMLSFYIRDASWAARAASLVSTSHSHSFSQASASSSDNGNAAAADTDAIDHRKHHVHRGWLLDISNEEDRRALYQFRNQFDWSHVPQHVIEAVILGLSSNPEAPFSRYYLDESLLSRYQQWLVARGWNWRPMFFAEVLNNYAQRDCFMEAINGAVRSVGAQPRMPHILDGVLQVLGDPFADVTIKDVAANYHQGKSKLGPVANRIQLNTPVSEITMGDVQNLFQFQYILSLSLASFFRLPQLAEIWHPKDAAIFASSANGSSSTSAPTTASAAFESPIEDNSQHLRLLAAAHASFLFVTHIAPRIQVLLSESTGNEKLAGSEEFLRFTALNRYLCHRTLQVYLSEGLLLSTRDANSLHFGGSSSINGDNNNIIATDSSSASSSLSSSPAESPRSDATNSDSSSSLPTPATTLIKAAAGMRERMHEADVSKNISGNKQAAATSSGEMELTADADAPSSSHILFVSDSDRLLRIRSMMRCILVTQADPLNDVEKLKSATTTTASQPAKISVASGKVAPVPAVPRGEVFKLFLAMMDRAMPVYIRHQLRECDDSVTIDEQIFPLSSAIRSARSYSDLDQILLLVESLSHMRGTRTLGRFALDYMQRHPIVNQCLAAETNHASGTANSTSSFSSSSVTGTESRIVFDQSEADRLLSKIIQLNAMHNRKGALASLLFEFGHRATTEHVISILTGISDCTNSDNYHPGQASGETLAADAESDNSQRNRMSDINVQQVMWMWLKFAHPQVAKKVDHHISLRQHKQTKSASAKSPLLNLIVSTRQDSLYRNLFTQKCLINDLNTLPFASTASFSLPSRSLGDMQHIEHQKQQPPPQHPNHHHQKEEQKKEQQQPSHQHEQHAGVFEEVKVDHHQGGHQSTLAVESDRADAVHAGIDRQEQGSRDLSASSSSAPSAESTSTTSIPKEFTEATGDHTGDNRTESENGGTAASPAAVVAEDKPSGSLSSWISKILSRK